MDVCDTPHVDGYPAKLNGIFNGRRPIKCILATQLVNSLFSFLDTDITSKSMILRKQNKDIFLTARPREFDLKTSNRGL